MDVSTYVLFQNSEVLSWTCPKCIADVMPFHDCSFLNSSGSEVSDSMSQCGSIDLPCLSSPAGLRVAILNCRSLLSVADEVYELFVHQNVDILAVTETWLDSSIADSEIFPYMSSVKLVRRDRNCHGGGVAFLLSTKVKYVIRSDLCEGHIAMD